MNEDESEILKNAKIVCGRLKKYGFSRYAATRPIHIISSSIMEARKANFKEGALIEYATNRTLLLSSREIGRELKKQEGKNREKLRGKIYKDVEKLVKSMYSYFQEHGFKEFILLTRYLSDATYVDMEFGGEKNE